VLGLFSSAWLNRYADFMLALGSVLVPVGAILLAHFFVLRRMPRVDDLYDARGTYARHAGFSVPGVVAWIAGTAAYHVAADVGSTIASFAVAMIVYVTLDLWIRGSRSGIETPASGRTSR
jgi:purine-cytosine permease-like protein